MRSDVPSGYLAKILADSTSRRFTVTIFAISLAVIVLSYLVSALALPPAFLAITGKDTCDPQTTNFMGICHYFKLEGENTWTAFISGMEQRNSFFLVSANAMRSLGTEVSRGLISHDV